MKTLLTVFITIIILSAGHGQTFPNTRAQLDSVYAVNIKMSKLYGTYIPQDEKDALARVSKMTPPDAIEKFKNAPNEVEVCRKLHLGIGRWMIVNWNFEEGSRLSHYLKKKGVLHPDDMAQYLLRIYYRQLNELPENSAAIIEELAMARKKTVQNN